MSTISSNLDQEDKSANKAIKTLYKLVYFKHFSASVVAVIDTRYSAVDAPGVIVVKSVWLLFDVINCGQNSI